MKKQEYEIKWGKNSCIFNIKNKKDREIILENLEFAKKEFLIAKEKISCIKDKIKFYEEEIEQPESLFSHLSNKEFDKEMRMIKNKIIKEK